MEFIFSKFCVLVNETQKSARRAALDGTGASRARTTANDCNRPAGRITNMRVRSCAGPAASNIQVKLRRANGRTARLLFSALIMLYLPAVVAKDFPGEPAAPRAYTERRLAQKLHKSNKTNYFVVAVKAPRVAVELCSEAHYQQIEDLAYVLSRDLINSSKHYKWHGMYGIFAQGSNWLDYKQTKSRFLFNRICPIAKALKNVCEIGFMAGHTSLLYLEALPNARVVSFELGDVAYTPWLTRQTRVFGEAYGDRFEMVKGPSQTTIPAYREAHPDFRCDAVFVDGAKTTEGRERDFIEMRRLSSPSGKVFFDEVTTQQCVNGTDERMCYPLKKDGTGRRRGADPQVYAAIGAYKASRAGIIKVQDCAWTPGYEGEDGICGGLWGAAHDDNKPLPEWQGEGSKKKAG